MPKQLDPDHIHELICPGLHKRDVPVSEKKWKCAHPDCFKTFKRDQIEGKRSICGFCHQNELILTKDALKNAFPRCLECSGRSNDVKTRRITGATKNLMDEVFAEAKEKEEKQEEIKEYCRCEFDFTDGTRICQSCHRERVKPTPLYNPANVKEDINETK